MSRNDELNSRAEMIEEPFRKAMPRDEMRSLQKVLQKERKKDEQKAEQPQYCKTRKE